MHEGGGVAESCVESYVTGADEKCDSGQQYQS